MVTKLGISWYLLVRLGARSRWNLVIRDAAIESGGWESWAGGAQVRNFKAGTKKITKKTPWESRVVNLRSNQTRFQSNHCNQLRQ